MSLTPHDAMAEDGTRLRIWEETPEERTESDVSESDASETSTGEAVLFVHGAITHSRALFAPPVETDGAGTSGEAGRTDDSYSWLRATADAG
jgi:hypothetical protein